MDYRHFFVVDDGGRVGKFDIGSKSRREYIEQNLPENFELDPIRIPEHAEGREQALEQLTDNTVDWDPRLEEL